MHATATVWKDPRWQRRRLEIFERDGFRCTECGDDKASLQVHHKIYRGSWSNPWVAPDDALTTLCEPCHEKRTNLDRALKERTANMPNEQLATLLENIDRHRNAIDVQGAWDEAKSRRLERLDLMRIELAEMAAEDEM